MPQETSADAKRTDKPVAFLVVREGSSWRDVFRLTPGQVTTIGRAPTNRIVIRDEICSRNHCEVFQSGSKWTLRDLSSRNGTLLNGTRVTGDSELSAGELIQIGSCSLGFTFDLSQPFPELETTGDGPGSDAGTAWDVVFDHPAPGLEPAIIHRQSRTRYQSSSTPEVIGRDRTSQELATLYRLALDMGAARDARELSEVVLDGLFGGTCADIGAILLLPKNVTSGAQSKQLSVIAYKAQGDLPYQKVSDYLSGVVLGESEAILARDVADDSRLASRDSLGEIHAQSVICAPIRAGELILGLLHLYSTNPDNPLDPDDLEFTLAVADQMAVALENLTEKESLAAGLAKVRDENLTLRRQLEIESQLIGDSQSLRRLRETIGRIAPTGATVMIRGESGVGKELVARAIHFNSDRRNGPFVCMNCAALSETLLESELFGHERGSFTGATARKIGKFEQAHNGSLFLDEVGEMSLGVQAKFLRVLEGHPYERLGGGRPVQVEVRVIAATNRDLERALEEGTFRKDLYFRLDVVEIVVEPLREHRSDIPLLANYFLERFARKTSRAIKGFTRQTLDALTNYDWPGNVRELQNAVERAVILCTGDFVGESDIQLSTAGATQQPSPHQPGPSGFRQISLGVLEQEHILSVLDWTNWNKSRAAQILGIERSTLDRKLKKYQVGRPKR